LAELYVPDGHAVHTKAVALLEYWPALHTLQLVWALFGPDPAEHRLHWAELEKLYVPEGQLLQRKAEVEFEYCPARHAVQTVEPVALELPAAQLEQLAQPLEAQ
jgi:hypothetical protein